MIDLNLRELLTRVEKALQPGTNSHPDSVELLRHDVVAVLEQLKTSPVAEIVQDLLRIEYQCPECGYAWVEWWPSACDSMCGMCRCQEISPARSAPVERDDDGSFDG